MLKEKLSKQLKFLFNFYAKEQEAKCLNFSSQKQSFKQISNWSDSQSSICAIVSYEYILLLQVKPYQLTVIINMNSNRKSRITTRSPSPKNNSSFLNTLNKFSATTSPFSFNDSSNSNYFNRSSPYKNQTICQIPKIEHSKKVSKVKISKEQLKVLNRSLQISKKANDQFEKRLKNNNLYTDYNINPFTQEFKKNIIQTQEDDKDFKKKKTGKNIIQVLRKGDIQTQLLSKAPKIDSNAKGYRQVMGKIIKKENQSKKINFKTQNIDKRISKIFTDFAETAKDPLQELQEIAAIKEDNFFHKKRNSQPFSLFEVLHNPKSVMFQSGSEQLQKYYFSFHNQRNTEQTLNDFCIRNISFYSRISTRNSNSKAIPSSFRLKVKDLSFKSQQISAINLFLFANGQIAPQIALQKLKIDEGEAIKLVQQKNTKISYKEKQQNRGTKIELVDKIVNNEQVYWRNHVPTQKEEAQQRVSKKYLIEMKNILQRQLNLLNNRINMAQVHQNFDKTKESILCKQLLDNTNLTIGLQNSNERKVRIFKQKKDKTEGIKLKMFSHILKEKQILDKSIKKYLRSKSKHKSSSKNK